MQKDISLFSPDLFKNASGKVFTKALFYELSYSQPENCVFTLKDEDIVVNGKTFYSLKKLYLSLIMSDPTEYTFAQTVFNEWNIWLRVKTSPTIVPFYDEWKDEAEVKIKSNAIKLIAEEASNAESRNSFQAAKLLLNKGWLDEEAPVGKRAKQKMKEEEAQDAKAVALLADDANRLGITVN